MSDYTHTSLCIIYYIQLVHDQLHALSLNAYRLEEHMVVKIADFGFSEKLYMKAYVRMVLDGTVKLPVKWMAPESICHEVFSEKTDVVRVSILLYLYMYTPLLSSRVTALVYELFTSAGKLDQSL